MSMSPHYTADRVDEILRGNVCIVCILWGPTLLFLSCNTESSLASVFALSSFLSLTVYRGICACPPLLILRGTTFPFPILAFKLTQLIVRIREDRIARVTLKNRFSFWTLERVWYCRKRFPRSFWPFFKLKWISLLLQWPLIWFDGYRRHPCTVNQTNI